ncbi:DUF5107 domain-containing protein [Granulicella arctica]|uniref:DUF5107 domain-containing protein n=1 Tax=Granulicella arctica TaxID=940613 RepID=UPI0021DFEB72|nr:DUF5107 domain-containing protein [Granulicella arctica]
MKKHRVEPSSTLKLPPAPISEAGAVKVWSEPVTMLTYSPATADINPLFLEQRVYQGSSGRVYPLPVVDAIETEPRLKRWEAVHLENESLRLMVMPEIGGRIHVGLDKRTGYDFFYRQNVIKPALVGLAGPWISGGVEFNWPQHHRPATYMPVEIAIEREPDGAVTVWCSDHDPMTRMKGMHGIRLRPGSATLEVRVRLYNRTEDTQTFLWWANVATRVHEQYQSFFPHDVHFAADHAKRAVTEYPLSKETYYGIDYSERARVGVAADEMPAEFVPDGSYAANDLGWYANIPVPTSYMIVGSQGDFFGGYDHKADAGTVAVASHHISPGKKQWTWGNHEFGYAWDRSLTDGDGPYVELMSGVYTDNQPDFSFLAPGETKTFSQFWYPIFEIGVPDVANLYGAVRVERVAAGVRVHVQTTADYDLCTLRLLAGDTQFASATVDMQSGVPQHLDFSLPETSNVALESVEILLMAADAVLLHYTPTAIEPTELPELATEPPLPEDVGSNDELYLIGLHLEQYRHPTRVPELYWLEAVRRDSEDSRSNHVLGRWHLRRGEFAKAEMYLRTAIERLTRRNPNPYDGEPHYNLGLTLRYLERPEEAYDAFYKSTWNAAWRGPAYQRLAEMDCGLKDWNAALDHIDRSLRAEADNLNARNLKVTVLRALKRSDEAEELLQETRGLDPLDIGSRWLADGEVPEDGQRRLDLGLDLRRAGLFDEALAVLNADMPPVNDGSDAMLQYAAADVLSRCGKDEESAGRYRAAAAASADYVFPVRLDELVLLKGAMAKQSADARAPYYLGNLLYDRRRHDEAIEAWERAVELDPKFPTAWRNLGFAYFNVRGDERRALAAFAKARELSPHDARILYEQDQLLKRTGASSDERLCMLEDEGELVPCRDDLSYELILLLNSKGRPAAALKVLESRQFGPWEGGEGLVLGQYVRANILLAREALTSGEPHAAVARLQASLHPPKNLGEALHLLVNRSHVDFWLGVAYADEGDTARAFAHWERAARQRGDFQQMQVQTISDMAYWSAMALRKLGREDEAVLLFEQIGSYGRALEQQTPKLDYFATSLPAMLLFREDMKQRQTVLARFLQAQSLLGLGATSEGLQMLGEVLELDGNYAAAVDLATMLNGR